MVDCAVNGHRILGPAFLESAHQYCYRLFLALSEPHPSQQVILENELVI